MANHKYAEFKKVLLEKMQDSGRLANASAESTLTATVKTGDEELSLSFSSVAFETIGERSGIFADEKVAPFFNEVMIVFDTDISGEEHEFGSDVQKGVYGWVKVQGHVSGESISGKLTQFVWDKELGQLTGVFEFSGVDEKGNAFSVENGKFEVFYES